MPETYFIVADPSQAEAEVRVEMREAMLKDKRWVGQTHTTDEWCRLLGIKTVAERVEEWPATFADG